MSAITAAPRSSGRFSSTCETASTPPAEATSAITCSFSSDTCHISTCQATPAACGRPHETWVGPLTAVGVAAEPEAHPDLHAPVRVVADLERAAVLAHQRQAPAEAG